MDDSIDSHFLEVYYLLAKIGNSQADESRLKACAGYCANLARQFIQLPIDELIKEKIVYTALRYGAANQFELSLAMEENLRNVLSGDNDEEKVLYLKANEVFMHNYKKPD